MSEDRAAYRVLARKYRPTTFAELIGQDVLVRTVTNAIAAGRLAHAYLLTGVRGVGKTSAARIIARALNCVGADGSGGPTAEPCGVCEHCVAIAQDRHVDVIEMDAASRTGVNDIRELIEGVRYRPVSARTKVYIIDEVHMLSGAAFNALLKTLEEPPPNVTFVFATTEVRKLPVTVLSRCQRFDLRRVEMTTLIEHFGKIAAAEGIEIEPSGLALIARAADGSVRDGLSLLDRAIAHSGETVSEAAVRDMLGLVDRTQIIDLFDLLMQGAAKEALGHFSAMYAAGAEPTVVLQDLLEFCHWLTRLKLVPDAAEDVTVPEAERKRGREIAEALTIAVLSRAWQMLLKGLEETRQASRPAVAAEMAFVRIAYAADLPTPSEALKALAPQRDGAPRATADAGRTAPASQTAGAPVGDRGGMAAPAQPARAQAVAAHPADDPRPAEISDSAPSPTSFAELVALVQAEREPLLAAWLRTEVRPVRVERGFLEINGGGQPNQKMMALLRAKLQEWTADRWMIALTDQPGAPTLAEREAAEAEAEREAALRDPLVRKTLDMFPGARVRAVHRRADNEPTEGDPRG